MSLFKKALPPIVGKKLAPYVDGEENGYRVAQISLPLLLQTVTTPLHLLGYEIYNNPKGNLASRVSFLQKDYFKNVSVGIFL